MPPVARPASPRRPQQATERLPPAAAVAAVSRAWNDLALILEGLIAMRSAGCIRTAGFELRIRMAAGGGASRSKHVRSGVLARLDRAAYNGVKTFESLPLLALDIAPTALRRLAGDPAVVRIQEDRASPPLLAESVPLIGADAVWEDGVTGAGTRIAILDTGIDADHPFLAGRWSPRPATRRRAGTRARSARAASPNRPPPAPAGAAPPESSVATTAPTSPAPPAAGAEPAASRATAG
jgi:subtilisin family serine protease